MRLKTSGQAEKILVAASRLFAERRFHEVRMDDLARVVEVSKGTLYRYFKDKEELYLALLDLAATGLRRHLDEVVTAASGPRGRLEAMVAGILDYFDANPYLLELLQHAEGRQLSGTLAKWQAVRMANISRFEGILEEGRLTGLWHVPEPRTPVLMLLGGLRSLIRLAPPPRAADLPHRIIEDFLYGACQTRSCSRADPAPAVSALR